MSSQRAEKLLSDQRARLAYLEAFYRNNVNIDAMQESQCQSFIASIACCGGLTLEDAAMLQRSISDSSSPNLQWTPAQVTAISTAIGDAISSSHDVDGAAVTRKNQSVKALRNYFTEDDINSWEMKEFSREAYEKIMAWRMYKWGIVCPDIKTLKIGASVLALAVGAKLDAPTLSEIAHNVRDHIKDLDAHRRYPFPHLVTYLSLIHI